MTSALLETWRVHNRATWLMFDALPSKAFGDRYTDRTRSVAAQFAHIHNVRVSHLQRRGPQHLGDLEAFGRGAEPGKTALKKALKASERAVANLLAECETTGKVRSWQNSVTTYLGYFIAHEAHHRALIMVCLRFSGTKAPDAAKYGIWDTWRKK